MHTRSRNKLNPESPEWTEIEGRKEVSSKNLKNKSKKPPSTSNPSQEDNTNRGIDDQRPPSTSEGQPTAPPYRHIDTPYPERFKPRQARPSPFRRLNIIPETDPLRDSPFKEFTPSAPPEDQLPPRAPPPSRSTPYPDPNPYSASKSVFNHFSPFASRLYQSPRIRIPELSESFINTSPAPEQTPRSQRRVHFDTSTPLDASVRRQLDFTLEDQSTARHRPGTPFTASASTQQTSDTMTNPNNGGAAANGGASNSTNQSTSDPNSRNTQGATANGGASSRAEASPPGYEQSKFPDFNESTAPQNGSIDDTRTEDTSSDPPPYGNTYFPKVDQDTAKKYEDDVTKDKTFDQQERLRLLDLIRNATEWTRNDPSAEEYLYEQPCFYKHLVCKLPIPVLALPANMVDPKEDMKEEIEIYFRTFVRDYINKSAEFLMNERGIAYKELSRAIYCLKLEVQNAKRNKGRPALLHYYYRLIVSTAMIETTLSLALYDKILPTEEELDLERHQRTMLYSQLDELWIKAMDLIRSSTLQLPQPGVHIDPTTERPELIPLQYITPAKKNLPSLKWKGRGNRKDARWLHQFTVLQKSGRWEQMLQFFMKRFNEQQAKTFLDDYFGEDRNILKDQWTLAHAMAPVTMPTYQIFKATIHRINTGGSYEAELNAALNRPQLPQPIIDRMSTDGHFRRFVMAHNIKQRVLGIQGPRMDRLQILIQEAEDYYKTVSNESRSLEEREVFALYEKLYKRPTKETLHDTTYHLHDNLTLLESETDQAEDQPGTATPADAQKGSGLAGSKTVAGGGGDPNGDPDDDPDKDKDADKPKDPSKDTDSNIPSSAADHNKRGKKANTVTGEDLDTTNVSTYTVNTVVGADSTTSSNITASDRQQLKESLKDTLDEMSTIPTKGKIYAGYTKNTEFNLDDVKPPTDLKDSTQMNQYFLAQNIMKDTSTPCREFSGKRIDWFEFWDEFTTNIDQNGRYRTITKFHKLRELLPEPAMIYIQHLLLKAENYGEAKKILIERYGQIKPYVTLLKQRFKYGLHPLLPHQPHSLTRFYGLIAKTIHELSKYAPNELSNDELLLHAQKQMDEATYIRWRKFLGKIMVKCSADPTLFEEMKYAALISFLKREMDVSDDLAINHYDPSRPKPRPQLPKLKRKMRGGRYNAYMVDVKENIDIDCFFCGKKHKYFPLCPNTTQAQRLTLVRKEDRCRRCLTKGHHTNECTSTLVCLNCQSTTHHVAICNKKVTNNLLPKKGGNGNSNKKSNFSPKSPKQNNNRQSNRNSNTNRRQNNSQNQNRPRSNGR